MLLISEKNAICGEVTAKLNRVTGLAGMHMAEKNKVSFYKAS